MALSTRGRGAMETALALLCLGAVVILAQVVAAQRWIRVDLTADQRHTLAPETRRLLGELDGPLEVRAFLPSRAPAPWSSVAASLSDLVESARAHAGGGLHLVVRDPTDPELTPAEQEALAEEARGYGVGEAEVERTAGDRRASARILFGAALLHADRQAILRPVRRSADLEFELARALRELLRPSGRPPLLLFSQGHGEPDLLASPLARQLGANAELRNVELSARLPANAEALVIFAPSRPMGPRARYVIDQLLMEGRTVVALLDYRQRSTVFPDVLVPVASGLEPLFAHYGLAVDVERTVIDRRDNAPAPLRRAADGEVISAHHPAFTRATDLAGHPITGGLRSLVMPLASPLDLSAAAAAGHAVTPLVRSGAGARAVRDLRSFDPEALATAAADERPGPFVLAATVEGRFPSLFAGKAPPAPPARPGPPPSPDPPPRAQASQRARLLVATSGRRMLAAGADSQVFLQGAVDWALTGTDLAALRARAVEDPPLRPVSAAARAWVKYGNVLGPPLALILFGLGRALWRRRR